MAMIRKGHQPPRPEGLTARGKVPSPRRKYRVAAISSPEGRASAKAQAQGADSRSVQRTRSAAPSCRVVFQEKARSEKTTRERAQRTAPRLKPRAKTCEAWEMVQRSTAPKS